MTKTAKAERSGVSQNGAEKQATEERGQDARDTRRVELRIEQVPIGLIVVNGDNVRKIDEKDPEFVELVGSVRAIGVQIPVLVRPHPDLSGKYQLRAGHRRLRAAQLAERATAPAIIYEGQADGEAELLTLIENKYRKDLLPLEEVAQCEKLMLAYKGDVRAVASKLGKPLYQTWQLVRINSNLSAKWKKAVAKEGLPDDWTVSHLALVAAQPANIQDDVLGRFWDFKNRSLAQIEEYFRDNQKRLDLAPWDLADAGLIAKAGACFKCPKQTGAQPELFDDEEDPEKKAKNVRCLDRECWKAKQAVFVARRAKELKVQYPELVLAVEPDKGNDYESDSDLEESFGPATCEYKKAKEGDKDAKPAMIINGAQAGEMRFIKIISSPSDSHSAGQRKSKRGGLQPKGLPEKKEALEKKRWSSVVNKVSGLVREAKVSQIVCDNITVTVMALTAIFGTTLNRDGTRRDWKAFAKLEAGKTPEVTETLWWTVRETIANSLVYSGPVTQVLDEKIESAKAAAKLLNIDIDGLFAEAVKEYPEPKSWRSEAESRPAGLSQDGAPSAVIPPKAKSAGGKAVKKNKKSKKVEPEETDSEE